MSGVFAERDGDRPARRNDVAIIGMACIFPGAPGPDVYWQNIVAGVDAISEVSRDRWDPEIFFEPGSSSPGRLYCKRGGYLGDLARCNPLEYGLMPVVMTAGQPDQVLCLRAAHEALADAGYATRSFDRERTEVVFGRGNYSSPAIQNVTLHTFGIEEAARIIQALHPEYGPDELEAIRRELRANLPRFGPDTAGTIIPNLTTGRVANRLDLMGANFTVDAACASALIALDLAMRDLVTGRCDLALVGGVHLATDVPFLAVFSQLSAMSRTSQIRPFDEKADGLLPGEGLGVVVLKRREDAERDGDRIYAVVKAVGTSSDGRGSGLLAPRVEGEELALRRAYEMAAIEPETIELIEAHGTGTPVGDLAEVQALSRVFGARQGPLPTCAIGSVKSMIGHLMPAAGIAGLIKAALALYHRTLPPTLHCETPNPQFELEKTPFYVSTQSRPWVHGHETPRRAGVSAFGFGGINAHVILEEASAGPEGEPPGIGIWETEVCLLQGDSRQALLDEGRRIAHYLETAPDIRLEDLAYTLNGGLRAGTVRLALVASSVEDLQSKLERALERLANPECGEIKDAAGVYFFEEPLLARGKLAFLFPGEASQYPNMLRDLCLRFPDIRAKFDTLDRIFLTAERPLRPSQSIYPVPGASDEEQATVERRLWEMGGALDAVLTANWALFDLLHHLGIDADIVLGHSSGELSALAAAGVLNPDAALLGRLADLTVTYERLAAEGKLPEAALAAVGADRASVMPLIEGGEGDVFLAMDNCPHQVVLVGREHSVQNMLDELGRRGTICQRLPFARAYHTPAFRTAAQPLDDVLHDIALAPPRTEIYSAATASPYPRTPRDIHQLIVELWSRPVEFVKSIDAIYDAGARLFVEVGPRGNLTAFVDDILRGRPHLAIPCDVPRRPGVTQLNHVVGLLAAQGIAVRFDRLYEWRNLAPLSFEARGKGEKGTSTGETLLSLAYPNLRLEPRPAAPPDAGSRQSVEPSPPDRTLTATPALAPPPSIPRALSDLASPLLAEAVPVSSGDGTAAPGQVSAALSEHFRTMERFLAVEQDIMEAYLEASSEEPAPAEAPPAGTYAGTSFALQGTVASMTAGQEVVVQRRIDPGLDLYLEDHGLGGKVSDVDRSLRPLPVVPFTVCLEMMAEVASLLEPDGVLTGIRNAHARQWIEVGTPIAVEIVARRQRAAAGVQVVVRNLGPADSPQKDAAAVAAEATLFFGPVYPEAPLAPPFPLRGERRCRYTAEQMYEERLMFHGPRFKGVVSLDSLGENGLVGHLAALPRADLFASVDAPRFLMDPMLADATGQLIGYWAAEHLATGYSMFPFRLGALDVYGECPAVGERLRCEVEILEVTPRRVRATMTVIGADGRVRLRFTDWEDWRFFWPREFYDCFRFPDRYPASQAWTLPLSEFPGRDDLVCQRLDAGPETTGTIATRIFPFLLFSAAERAEWASLKVPEKRQTEWILGRVAAKDAVRRLLKARYGVDLCPADVEIGHDEDGRLWARAPSMGGSPVMPAVSITHSDGYAIALAGYTGRSLGIDLERIRSREDGFLRIAFSDDELELLGSVDRVSRDEWTTRLWCAKEAIAKAVGKGLADGPRSVVIRAIDARTGRVNVTLGAGLARRVPELSEATLVAHTGREGEWAVAVSVGEAS